MLLSLLQKYKWRKKEVATDYTLQVKYLNWTLNWALPYKILRKLVNIGLCCCALSNAIKSLVIFSVIQSDGYPINFYTEWYEKTKSYLQSNKT